MLNPQLPLVDIHRHLDGNIRPETIWFLAQQHQIPLTANSLEALIPMTQIQGQSQGLLSFLQKLDYGVSVLADYQACYRVAYENVEDIQLSGLDYAELRFSPRYMAQAFNLNMQGVVEAVIAGVQDALKQIPVQARLIGILSRTYGIQACMEELTALMSARADICGLDLAGDEGGYPAPLFEEHFKLARDTGWQITVHAGEAAGPQSIRDAIHILGASRIGHGVAAIEDPELMDYLAQHQIAIESCPTSNYQTMAVADLSKHPLPEFLRRGMLVTINTDDPAVSGIDIRHEYQVARERLGLSSEELATIQRNGVEAAFLSSTEKQTLLNQKAS